MDNADQPYWVSDMSNQEFTRVLPQTFAPFLPTEHMLGVHQQQYAPFMVFPPATYAAPAQQHLPSAYAPAYAPLYSHYSQYKVRPSNGVFIPTFMDLARGRINQAVHDARWNHEYVDNTAKAIKARAAFDQYFGTDTTNLEAWQDMCFFCGKEADKMPATIKECKVFLRSTHVNIFDFVTAVDNFMSTKDEMPDQSYQMSIPTFPNVKKLEQYTRDNALICPARVGRGNDLFRFMLAKWF